jgi:hypothetical protein
MNLNTLGPQAFNAEVGNSPINGGRRAEAVDNGLVQVGRGIRQAAAGADEVAESNETRDALVQSHEIRTQYLKELQDAHTSGADLEAIHTRFQDDQQLVIDNLTYNGSLKAARMASSESSSMLSRQMHAINAEREGAAMKQSVIRADTAYGQQLQLAPDMLPFVLEQRDQVLETYKGRIPPHILDAVRLEGEIALTRNSVESMIQKDPETAKDWLENPEKAEMWGVLDADHRAALIRSADAMIDARYADGERARRAKLQLQQEQNDKAFDGMLVDFGTGKMDQWSREKILTLQGITPEMKTHMASVLEAYRKDEDKDPADFTAAYKGIVSGAFDRGAIDDMLLGKGMNGLVLDPKQHAYLSDMFTRMEKPDGRLEADFVHRMDQVINPRDMLGRMLSPDGAMNSYKFATELRQMTDMWTKAGGKAEMLLDPNSKEFRENVQPLLMKYRAKTLYNFDAQGGTTLNQAPGAAAQAPVTVQRGQETALPPGTWYRFPDTPAGKAAQRSGEAGAPTPYEAGAPLPYEPELLRQPQPKRRNGAAPVVIDPSPTQDIVRSKPAAKPAPAAPKKAEPAPAKKAAPADRPNIDDKMRSREELTKENTDIGAKFAATKKRREDALMREDRGAADKAWDEMRVLQKRAADIAREMSSRSKK